MLAHGRAWCRQALGDAGGAVVESSHGCFLFCSWAPGAAGGRPWEQDGLPFVHAVAVALCSLRFHLSSAMARCA